MSLLCTVSDVGAYYYCVVGRLHSDIYRGHVTLNSPHSRVIHRAYASALFATINLKQGVALTGRNCTGPPCSVGHPTAHAPSPPAGSVTEEDDRRHMPASKTILAH